MISKKIKPRLRLAPSPTGFLHLGNFRTALFGYLLARHWQGDFILRIEDTDRERHVSEATESLIKVFTQLGISFDEGPYIQSERLSIYREQAEALIKKGEAYYCFATSEELEKMRSEQISRHEPPRYDRRFRDYPQAEAKKRIAAGESYVIRHKMPLEGEIKVTDELRGEITFPAVDLEDYVLLKSDGYPTYQLAAVVDDHLMNITHVTRGDEWLPSLPKNILLYKSFGWEAPKFIHFPVILNKSGGKLSKRQGDVFVEDYLKRGYLPEAIINFCALLGWHPKSEQEFFSLKELEKVFDLDGVGISPAIFDQEKLDFFNAHYIRLLSLDELLTLAKPFLPKEKSDDFLKNVLVLEQPRLRNLEELKNSTDFFFKEKIEYDINLLTSRLQGMEKQKKTDTRNHLNELKSKLSTIVENDWTKDKLEEIILAWLREDSKSFGDYLWPMRVALSGKKASPGPFEIASVLGIAETLDKIDQAISMLS